jgi:site-specific DNA recombinase
MKAKTDRTSVRCAIYTRKSTEEGLDQAFNSLDAQREACEAYAASQRHEGWQVLKTHYDDGGFSGGNINRPALQQLMADIKAGQIDLVLVYKIDRLTRSLIDFSKLVEVFDQHQTSFVSVTQHFNTTSSMGRLTLNVLLSFAQFEREVTGERIRDKVAASKRKGMWMGGPVPLGYRLVNKGLVIDEVEAMLVRRIFERYCALGCVAKLKVELDEAGVEGRVRLQRDGATDARAYSRGALYAILNRRLYIGEVQHKKECFEGQHAAIIPKGLWDQAQALLGSNRQIHRNGERAKDASLLAGMVSDGDGNRLTPSHTTKGKKRYRYYLTRPTHEGGKRLCLPAHDVERIVVEQWLALLTSDDLDEQLGALDSVHSEALRANACRLAGYWRGLSPREQRETFRKAKLKVLIRSRQIEICVDPVAMTELLIGITPAATGLATSESVAQPRKAVGAKLVKSGGETRILEPEAAAVSATLPNTHLVVLKAVAQGRGWARMLIAGEVDSAEQIASRFGVSPAHVARGLKSLNLSPELVSKAAMGEAPPDLTWAAIRKTSNPEWDGTISR